MRTLQYLDLGGNRLGLTPDVSQLTELETLYLPDTDITQIPQGLFALRELRTLDLSDNLIEEVPADFLQLATQLDTASDLSGNPLSAASLDILRQYYTQTGDDLEVAAAGLDANGNPLVRSSSPEPTEE
jgi:Leucine-rich repeat (LRR) protein